MRDLFTPRKIYLAIGGLVLAALSACGGGTPSNGGLAVQPTPVIYAGRFVDAPVAGLTYSTATRTGTTDANGYFQYDNPDEEIRFSIGALQIGQAKATNQIHVYDLSGSQDDQLAGRNVRVAQLLQSLDQDGGKTNVIQIPSSASLKVNSAISLNFGGSQTEYDTSLRTLLSFVEGSTKFVSREVAKAKADAYVTELLTQCPLAMPASPDATGGAPYRIVTGNLTCMDIAKINYYQLRVAPLLYSQIQSGQAQAALVQEAWSVETAQALIDRNPVIALLQTIDAVVDAVEPEGKVNAVTQSAALGKVFLSASQAMVNLLIAFDESDGSAIKDADLARKNLELTNKVLDVLSGSASCTAFPKTRSDVDASVCVKSIADALSALEKGYDLPWFKLKDASDQAKLKAELTYVADLFDLASATLKVSSALDQGGDKLRRAGFGLAGTAIKTARDSITLVYTARGIAVPKTGWVAVTTGVLDNVFTPIAELGKNCWGVSKLEPTSYAKCVSTEAQMLIKVSLNASVALIGSVEAVRTGGTINEAVVAQAILEEMLWAGSVNFDTVFAKYGVAASNNPNRLVASIGQKKHGLYGVQSYTDMFSLIWATTWLGQNTFNIPDTMSLVGSYLSLINQNTTPDFSSSSILLASESGAAGVVNVRVIVTPEKNGFSTGKVICYSHSSIDHSIDAPWQGDVNGPTTQNFSLSYSSAGPKVVMCSLFTASRLFVGSKAAVATAVLPLRTIDLVTLVTPAKVGITTTFNIAGTNLPPTAPLDITFNGCANIQFVSQSATQHQFTCTPSVAGTLTAVIRTLPGTTPLGSFPVVVSAATVASSAIDIPATAFVRGVNVALGNNGGTGLNDGYGADTLLNAPPYTSMPNAAEWDFNVSTSGQYELFAEYAALVSRPVTISINGSLVFSSALSNATGGWYPANRQYLSQGIVQLAAGANTMRVARTDVFPHIKGFTLVPVSLIEGSFQVNANDPLGTSFAVPNGVTSCTFNATGNWINNGVTLNANGDPTFPPNVTLYLQSAYFFSLIAKSTNGYQFIGVSQVISVAAGQTFSFMTNEGVSTSDFYYDNSGSLLVSYTCH